MAAKRLTREIKPRVVPEDLEGIVRETVRQKPGLAASGFKKALPASHQAYAKEAVTLAQALVAQGALHGFLKGKTTHFFERPPEPTLDEALLPRLSEAPLETDALKALVRVQAPGHEVVVESWLKSAISRGLLFKHALVPPSKKARFGARPDVGTAIAPVLKALSKALTTTAATLPRELILAKLAEVLGVPLPAPVAKSGTAMSSQAAGEQLLAALDALSTANPREVVFSTRQVRARAGLDKEQFDASAVALARERRISLHAHDHPSALTPLERDDLVRDAGGTYYIGIAPRRGE